MRHKDPAQINRHKKFEKDIMSKYPFFVPSDYPHEKKVASSNKRKGLEETKTIAKSHHAKAMEETRLKNEKRKEKEDERYEAIMNDAVKALDKDGSTTENQLAEKIKFIRIEHTTPDQRNAVMYINSKFIH